MCPCFHYADVFNTSSHNFDLVLTAQVHEHARYLNTNGLFCSFIRFCIQNFNHVTCQANTISPELQAILMVLFCAFLLTLRLLKSNALHFRHKKEYYLSIRTPFGVVYSKHHTRFLTHPDIVALLTDQKKHLHTDPKLIRVFVSNKLICVDGKIDLQKVGQISVSVKALGGGRPEKINGPCEIPNCGRAEETGKYHRLIKFQPEIRNTIITSSDSKLSDNSVVCNKCFTNLKRQPDLKKAAESKKKKLKPKCIIPDCPDDSVTNFGGNKDDFFECFGTSECTGLDGNDMTISLCNKHNMQLFHFSKKCTLCNSRIPTGKVRHCQEPELLLIYWSEIFPGESINITKDDRICEDCYFAFQKLKKQNSGGSSDTQLKTFLVDHSPSECKEHKYPIDCALHCTYSHLASALLNGSVILLPELFAFFEKCLFIYQTGHSVPDSEIPKKSARWLLSCLISNMSDHFLCHTYKKSKKHGTLLYRKGCNVLNMLHLTAYKQYNLVQQLRNSADNVRLGEHSEETHSLTNEELKETYHTALNLNDKIYSMNLRCSELFKCCEDLSEITLSDIVKQIDPVVWNFFTILSLNKSQLETFKKSFDFDWTTPVNLSDISETAENSVLRRILISSLFMFMQNPSCHLLQSQLTELIDSHSRSSELVKVLNKFGVSVSRDTMSRSIIKAVKNLTEDKIKLQANQNYQSFKVATVDNVDQNVKSGEIVFGKKQENMHATTVQSVEPGPSLFINNESDFCSFVRQNKEQTEKSNSNLLQQIQVYGDGRCLFRCIASRLNTTLLLCERNEGGMPLDPETAKAGK